MSVSDIENSNSTGEQDGVSGSTEVSSSKMGENLAEKSTEEVLNDLRKNTSNSIADYFKDLVISDEAKNRQKEYRQQAGEAAAFAEVVATRVDSGTAVSNFEGVAGWDSSKARESEMEESKKEQYIRKVDELFHTNRVEGNNVTVLFEGFGNSAAEKLKSTEYTAFPLKGDTPDEQVDAQILHTTLGAVIKQNPNISAEGAVQKLKTARSNDDRVQKTLNDAAEQFQTDIPRFDEVLWDMKLRVFPKNESDK